MRLPSHQSIAASVSAVIACCFLVGDAMAAPGGFLVEGISDEFTTLSSIWSPGLRGMPESLIIQNGVLSFRSVDNGDDPYPSAEDMLATYADAIGQPLLAAEGPSIVGWFWFPPFAEWPTGTNYSGFREWLGLRVTAYDADMPFYSGLYWPGIYAATDDAGPCFIARVGDGFGPDITIGRITTSGWWTLGLAWNAAGRTEYYAAPGRVTLTQNDRLHTTPTYEPAEANRSIDQVIGTFLALRMTYPSTGQLSPDWRIDRIGVYVNTPPPLPRIIPSKLGATFHLDINGCRRGFRYLLQSSSDLANWNVVQDIVSNGAAWTHDEAASARRFYRVSRP